MDIAGFNIPTWMIVIAVIVVLGYVFLKGRK